MSRRKNRKEKSSQTPSSDIDEASDASFPASDPPSWTLGSEEPSVAPPPPVPRPPSSAVTTTLTGFPPPIVQGPNTVAAPPFDAPTPTGVPVLSGGASAQRERPPRRKGIDTVLLARVQGGYFALTGAWPLLHMRSFQSVTGGKHKSERWLVKTVGVLVGSIGAALIASTAHDKRPDRSMRLLATTSALGLMAIEVWYVAKRQLSPVYLVDAVGEAALAFGWSVARSG